MHFILKGKLVIIALAIIAIFATLPFYCPPYIVILLIGVLMYMTLGVSWNSFCGPANYVSLATAAFFGVGVYTSAILQSIPVPIVVLIAGGASAVLGFLVGLTTLRLRGMYFAIFTFGLSELFRNGLQWYEVNVVKTVGRWLPMLDHVTVYYYMFGIFVLTLATAVAFRRSRYGLALTSIGQSEDAAAHIGIRVNAVKIGAFAGSCFFMGAAGAVMARRWSYIDPNLAFDVMVTLFTVIMVLTGGIGSTIVGPIIGAAVLTVLSDTVLAQLPNQTMLMFGSLVVIVVLFLPNGLAGLIIRKGRPGNKKARIGAGLR